MSFPPELLEAPPEVYGRALALASLYGTANSYVRGPRGRKPGATVNAIGGQVKRARRAGASEEEIRHRIRKGITDPPKVIAERVEEVKRRFLS